VDEFSVRMLYGLSRIQKVKQWQARAVENDDGSATIFVESGYVGGKIQSKPRHIKEGKNIGKTNQTTPFQQAMSEIESQWRKKRDQNYEPYMIDPATYVPRIMLPMLASDPKSGKIKFPAFIQPKLNGICDLAELTWTHSVPESVVLHHSRGGKLFDTLSHLDMWISALKPPAPLHGELYYHGWSLQKIGSYTKKLQPDQHLLQYWIYDMAQLGVPFKERFKWIIDNVSKLQERYPDNKCPLVITPTQLVNNYVEAKAFHDECVQNGFEGAMLKNANGLYIFEYESNDIEKVKEFMDAEFEIIGGKEGSGTDEGCIIYRCITDDGKEFDVRPRGTVESRQAMLRNLPNDIGKNLTVRFAEWSDEQKPLQPVGITIRDYE